MNPIAAETDSGIPVDKQRENAADERERDVQHDQSALRNDWNASNRSRKMSRIDSGTISARRAIARCWFSNSPDQMIV